MLHHIPHLPPIGAWMDNFNMDVYMTLFDPVNINTLISQAIVVVLLIWLHKEIIKLARALIKKIPQIKSFGRTEFELPDTTKEAVDKESGQLDKKLKPYQDLNPNNPSGVFLAIFRDVEGLLYKLFALHFNSKAGAINKEPIILIIRSLFSVKAVSERFINDFDSARELRNQLSHSNEILDDVYDIEVYSKALLLLKDELANSIKKYGIKKEQ